VWMREGGREGQGEERSFSHILFNNKRFEDGPLILLAMATYLFLLLFDRPKGGGEGQARERRTGHLLTHTHTHIHFLFFL